MAVAVAVEVCVLVCVAPCASPRLANSKVATNEAAVAANARPPCPRTAVVVGMVPLAQTASFRTCQALNEFFWRLAVAAATPQGRRRRGFVLGKVG